jgi:peptidoglycan/LPS O-acetylase OafA/YrhL
MHKRFYRPQLDVVRFFAFFAVFCHHVLPRTGVSALAAAASNAMGFGLSLFFVLSAYLITLVLLKERETTGRIHLASFYKRRILRIWPLYLVGIGIGVLRAYHHGVLLQQRAWFIAALLLSGNLIYPGTILMSHLWSISVEEQFYLLFPSACSRFGRRGMLVLALLLIILANMALMYFAYVHAYLDTTIWFNSLVQFEMFAAGILLALADYRLPRLGVSASLAGASFSLGIWLFVADVFNLKTMGAVAQSVPAVCLGYALVALACCIFIMSLQGLPAWQPFIYSGKISYGLYVFHIPAIALIGTRFSSSMVDISLSLALSYALATLSYHFFETPFLKLKRNFELVHTRAV